MDGQTDGRGYHNIPAFTSKSAGKKIDERPAKSQTSLGIRQI